MTRYDLPLTDYDRGFHEGLLTQHNASGAVIAELQSRLTRSEHHNVRLRVVLFFAVLACAVLVVICVVLAWGRF